MSSDLALTDSISQSVAYSETPTAKNATGNITTLENIKEVDEEVQYQIAQAQSPLSATSKASWQLCKPTLSPNTCTDRTLLNISRCHSPRSFLKRNIKRLRWQSSRVHQCGTSVSQFLPFEVGWIINRLGVHPLQCCFNHWLRLRWSYYGLLWASPWHAIWLYLHNRRCGACSRSPDTGTVQSLSVLVGFRRHPADSFSSCLCYRDHPPSVERPSRWFLQHLLREQKTQYSYIPRLIVHQFTGSITGTGVVYGTSLMKGTIAWRLRECQQLCH